MLVTCVHVRQQASLWGQSQRLSSSKYFVRIMAMLFGLFGNNSLEIMMQELTITNSTNLAQGVCKSVLTSPMAINSQLRRTWSRQTCRCIHSASKLSKRLLLSLRYASLTRSCCSNLGMPQKSQQTDPGMHCCV